MNKLHAYLWFWWNELCPRCGKYASMTRPPSKETADALGWCWCRVISGNEKRERKLKAALEAVRR